MSLRWTRLALCGILLATHASTCTPPAPRVHVQAVTLDARNTPSFAQLPALRSAGVTHIALVQFGFQRDASEPEIRMQPDARWFSESDRGARRLARQADSLGMKVILKPHLWMGSWNAGTQTRSEIGYDSEADWQTWEASYTTLVMHYARLAEEIGAEMLVIGTELARSVRERPQFWRGLIAEIRGVYSGGLTYAANWWDEYEHVTFWDALDCIGVQAYFELSEADNPDLEMLQHAWDPHKVQLERISRQFGKNVLFTEIGYRNVADAAAKPWRWPSRTESHRQDDALQARLYEAFFSSFWHEAWFDGAILWKYHGDRDRRRGHMDFSPQGKSAEAVIRRWFTSGSG